MRRLSRALQRGEALAGAGRKWMISWRPCLRSARGAPTVAATGAMEVVGLEGVDSPSVPAGDTIRGSLSAPVGLNRIPKARKSPRDEALAGRGQPGQMDHNAAAMFAQARALWMVRLWGLWRRWIWKG